MQNAKRLAAVDLGSNSFRLELGTAANGQFFRSNYFKETIRQGGGLDEQSRLKPRVMQQGWECLARFGQLLVQFEPHEVLAVATQTLREAQNRDDFLILGSHLLGFPICVISGEEEARLIYQGVVQSLPDNDQRRLVLDIGGRSTEFIVGQGSHPIHMRSYAVGSIAWSMRYFPDQVFTTEAFSEAQEAARSVLQEAAQFFQSHPSQLVYGSAGTINAVVDVLSAAGWPNGSITRASINWLRSQLLAAKDQQHLFLPGMRDDRKPIIGGGLSVVSAVFDVLGVEHIQQSNGGLRHGLLQDMMQRIA
jgi:exopolyphosphatase/guanosine-5'-triphosphate,3'-diphosphate pyrophosphatase